MSDVNFTIRIEKHLKDAFLKSCKAKDSNASREMRLFIRSYIAKHGQQSLKLVD
jgi:hypothetical protein